MSQWEHCGTPTALHTAVIWERIQVSSIGPDITEVEFNQITTAMAWATESLLGPDSAIYKRAATNPTEQG